MTEPAGDGTVEERGEAAPLLSVDRIRVTYGAVTALRDVSLDVRPGEIVAALGPNGAGKSTLLRTIAGVLRPQSGAITFRGAPLAGMTPEAVVRRGIALGPEGRHIFPALTVEENLVVGGTTRSDRSEVRRDADGWLERFSILGQRRTQLAGTLSGGEQQQLAIARALMARPAMLLLDEPSLGLAPIVVDRIFALISELRADGVTILLVEQNVHRALEIADRAFVLTVGEVVASGPAGSLAEGELERSYLGIARGA